MLDDTTVGYFDSETGNYVPRGNTTNEDDVFNLGDTTTIRDDIYANLVLRSRHGNHTENLVVYQVVGLCELWDNDKPGLMITKTAFSGFTIEEVQYVDGKFTYKDQNQDKNPYLQIILWYHENLAFPNCIKTLKTYLKKRGAQVNRKVKPRVRIIQKANTDSGVSRVSCLATGFYPRHINLTLFRDGQPVSDHEITGGDLLPNGDGTYQMRKSLEISAEEQREKHKYTCSATHLSLDNKLDIDLEYEGKPITSIISSVLMVLVFLLVLGTGAAIITWKRRRTDATKSDYSSTSTSDEHVETPS
ncbi:major histocompatibility complex class I-related gene protein-like isoform X2 [Myxocyprinus asiaticus]|nr:major histocompatibility complex class I-related gene protein-like isoform X2 [Myxocyprinus asiaticus]XP_051545672.1 major histocompatibility complex class I-related gene protein-like isoform X2 [Myxocyprinus asiaticus]